MDTPNFNELFDLNEVNEILDSNRDSYQKEIGDLVTVLDFSSCTHVNGMELDFEDQEEMDFGFITKFIVVETRQNRVYDALYKKYRQDLIIANILTKKYYRINSGHVKLN